MSLSARVFKTVVDPFIGKYSLMKICTGTLKPDSVIYNVNKDAEEKVQKIYVLRGKEAIEVPELKAGDIGAVAKLTVTQTGDYDGSPHGSYRLPQAEDFHSVYLYGIRG